MPVVGLIGLSLVWIETRSSFACGVARPRPASVIGWTALLVLLTVGFITPVLQPLIDTIIGHKTDYSAYGALKGNLQATTHLIGAAWLSAALGEELVFRAFLMHQLDALLGRLRGGHWIAALAGGVVFGLMHAAQGASGILLTGVVGTMFGYAYLRSRRNLWAMILAHGLIDTWGVTTLYLGWY
ncbi:CPBP family intramembrane glutamic endopeptidase [Xanthomonas sp. D-109]|uniref:CPBP family intramembrane glutamic endopeptidase n=1 Tax=Xanthomonas sp. D-109 TaxID=2821274 RepID=UPI001ADB8ACB|nr:CPBP family intramembrane glutamic endopeptidase [Xanthomonas sp. D-109]MBO9882123.1 CPBP family intramembrane metalloprotease [Xanthomonas sp. D-109]